MIVSHVGGDDDLRHLRVKVFTGVTAIPLWLPLASEMHRGLSVDLHFTYLDLDPLPILASKAHSTTQS